MSTNALQFVVGEWVDFNSGIFQWTSDYIFGNHGLPALWKPYVNLDDAGLWDNQMANREMSKLEKSEAMCVASLTRAKLFDIIPPEM